MAKRMPLLLLVKDCRLKYTSTTHTHARTCARSNSSQYITTLHTGGQADTARQRYQEYGGCDRGGARCATATMLARSVPMRRARGACAFSCSGDGSRSGGKFGDRSSRVETVLIDVACSGHA